MTTYQIFISNCGKFLYHHVGKKTSRSLMMGIFLFQFHYEVIATFVSQYSVHYNCSFIRKAEKDA